MGGQLSLLRVLLSQGLFHISGVSLESRKKSPPFIPHAPRPRHVTVILGRRYYS